MRQVFKNGPVKFVKDSLFVLTDHITSNLLQAGFHKFYLIHS